MATVGYARVSSVGQSLEVQLQKLSEFGCQADHVFKEKRSGLTAQRQALEECLRFVRKGDLLVVTKLDRLARSTLDLHRIIEQLNTKGVAFKVLDQAIDTTTKEGRLMFSILASIAEFETELRKERQMEGIAKAKANGVKFGRQSALSPEQVAEMRQKRAQGVLIKDLMAQYQLSKASVYRLLRPGHP
ncbi:MAG: recombinase family protein [Proteobacteria bacterium]|nr:recombinase family protein [Pseudomonadota bacterium]